MEIYLEVKENIGILKMKERIKVSQKHASGFEIAARPNSFCELQDTNLTKRQGKT